MYTLFKAICGGVSWQEICDPLWRVNGGAWGMIFLLYIGFTYFAVMNVVTGVFCHSAIRSASLDQDMALQTAIDKKVMSMKALTELFEYLDHDKDGSITIMEFEEKMQDDYVQAYFATLDLSAEQGWTVFKLLDSDVSGALDLDEFVTGCLQLGGLARSLDLATIAYEVDWMMEKLSSFITYAEKQFHRLRLRSSESRSSAQSACDSQVVRVVSAHSEKTACPGPSSMETNFDAAPWA